MLKYPNNLPDICLTMLDLGLFSAFVDEAADGQQDDE